MRALLLTLFLTTTSFAQLAPVVESQVVASITSPEEVESGGIFILDIAGTSDGDMELNFWPDIPDKAIKYDTEGDLIYVTVCTNKKFPVPYSVVLRIESGEYAAMAAIVFNVLPAGDIAPPPNDLGITKELINKWLASVPKSVRDNVVKNPVTGEEYTSQEAVGKTFVEVGKVSKSLGSIKAINVMLTNGMVASFGDSADKWESFAGLIDTALKELEDSGAIPVKYGQVLSFIGEALQ